MGRKNQGPKRLPRIQPPGSNRNRNTGTKFSFCLLTALALFIDPPLRSQQPPQITLNVNAVNMLATVRDKHGNIVRNLTKDDFHARSGWQTANHHYTLQRNLIFPSPSVCLWTPA